MLSLYRDLRTAYFVVGISFGCVIVFMGIVLREEVNGGILTYFLAFIYIIACALIFQQCAVRRYRKMLNIMQEDCQNRFFIETCTAVCQKRKHLKPAVQTMLMQNIFVGYFNLGDLQTAMQFLERMRPESIRSKTQRANFLFSYAHSQMACAVARRDNPAALQWYSQMEALVKDMTLESMRESCYRNMERLRARMFVQDGEYEKAEMTFFHAFHYGKNKSAKVHAGYYLGLIYRHTGKAEEARPMFEFAVQNGGDCLCAAKAREELAAL